MHQKISDLFSCQYLFPIVNLTLAISGKLLHVFELREFKAFISICIGRVHAMNRVLAHYIYQRSS